MYVTSYLLDLSNTLLQIDDLLSTIQGGVSSTASMGKGNTEAQ